MFLKFWNNPKFSHTPTLFLSPTFVLHSPVPNSSLIKGTDARLLHLKRHYRIINIQDSYLPVLFLFIMNLVCPHECVFIWKRKHFVAFSCPVHTKTMKTQTFENDLQSGKIWKRNSIGVVWTGRIHWKRKLLKTTGHVISVPVYSHS